MYDQGIDIVYTVSGGSGLGVFAAAESRGLYAIGSDANQNHVKPDQIVFSTVRNLDSVVFETIKAAQAGQFEGGWHQLGVKENAVGIAFEGSNVAVDPAYVKAMDDFRAQIISGAVVIPSAIEDVDAFVAALPR